ncbi:hypothetical protein [Roseibium algae]|uniref:Uncharacterized protein n=1 Tax=Roseibium algae TaxID=3123038 RepID=A0ABU8TP17_9HYPH
MAIEDSHGHADPYWFVAPGESDRGAWVALIILLLVVYGVITLYAAFDRWAEHHSSQTPLAKTIPTLLTIALLYEIFPLAHFSILLPITAILLAVMLDWTHFNLNKESKTAPEHDVPVDARAPEGSHGHMSDAVSQNDDAMTINGETKNV